MLETRSNICIKQDGRSKERYFIICLKLLFNELVKLEPLEAFRTFGQLYASIDLQSHRVCTNRRTLGLIPNDFIISLILNKGEVFSLQLEVYEDQPKSSVKQHAPLLQLAQ